MAGLFDMFGGSPQSQGLLAAAAQILQASGPSRTPTGLGAILGSGISAYQQQEQQARQLGQLEQMRGLQIKNAESDLAAQEAQRERAQNLLSLSKAWGSGRGSQSPQGGVMPAARLDGGEFVRAAQAAGLPGDNGTLNRIVDQVNQGQQPGPAAMDIAGRQPQSQPATGRNALVQERLQYAQYLRDNGYVAEANAAEDQALKLQPKVKEWQKVNVGDQTLYAPYFEDGTNGQPVPLEVAQNLERVNLGGTTELINPTTGKSVRSMKNTATPGDLLQAATQREGFARADARAERANPANKPLPLGAIKIQDDGLEKLTTATGINSQLSAIRGQIGDGTLSFGPVSNLMNQGLNAAGISTDGSRAFANFRVTLEKLRNDSLRLNTGVQTDGDAQREWNALFQNINDTKWVAQRLEAIESLNARAAELQKLRIDGVRANYGHAPLDFTPYEQAGTGGAAPTQQPRQAAAGGKVATLSDIAATARASGRSTAEVTAALRAKGYTIGGR